MEKFGIEIRHRVLKRVRLWSRDCAADGVGVKTMSDKLESQEVDGVLKTAGVVASIGQKKIL